MGAAVQQLEPSAVKTMMDAGMARLVDVREPLEHRAERIAGATLSPLSTLDGWSARKNDDGLVVVHCKSGKRGMQACERLAAAGWTNVGHLAGGIEAWKAAGLPVEVDQHAPMDTMRQTQIAMGLMVLVTVALGVFVSAWALVVTAVIGGGMVFAGATGTCAMARWIGRMPWNRR